MYRGGAQVNPGPMNTVPSNFYSFDESASRSLGAMHTPPFSGHSHLSNMPNQPVSHNLDAADVGKKMDQMMTLLTSTQQMVLAQQSSTHRLEDTVVKLSQDVTELQQYITSNETAGKSAGKTSGKKMTVPKELSVSVLQEKSFS